jgi:hypothetical protein
VAIDSSAPRLLFLSLCLLTFVLMGLRPARAAEPAIPDELRSWVGWVEASIPDYGCAHLDGRLVCGWPGKLTLDVGRDGARFALEVWLERPAAVELPGGRGIWPQDVRVQNRPVAVVGDEQPRVELPRGNHVISGRFVWAELPEIFPVPASIGVVHLFLDGEAVPHPRHDQQGRLWLKEGRAGTVTEADSLRVSVYRRIEDRVPLSVTTRLELNVSGRAREVELGPVLLPGSRAIVVRGALPVQVEPGGEVGVYVRPGTHTLDIVSVIADGMDGAVTMLNAPARDKTFFDPQETWTWHPNERLRSVDVSGLTAVDPERTTLPSEWKGAATYLASPGDSLTLTQTRRGQADAPPNVLHLNREIWMDLDGKGATSRDRLTGTMHRGWRLDYGESGELGRIAQNGSNLLITEGPGGGAGVELRDASVNLEADIRLAGRPTALPIVGWHHDVQSLNATLHTPPGWTVLGAGGVDKVYGAWLSSWNLLDFFFVLIVALSFAKLFGWPWGVAAAVGLVLSQDVSDAPRWIWVQLLISLALLRVLTRGPLRRLIVAYRAVVLIALFTVLATFVQDQIQEATHPQVASPYGYGYSFSAPGRYGAFELAPSAPMAVMQDYSHAEEEADSAYELEASRHDYRRSGSTKELKAKLQQIDPNAVVQTGPGVPNWSWRSWQLQWSGPVGQDHEIRLWLLSPFQNGLVIAVRLALLILLGLLIISRKDMYWRDPDDGTTGTVAPPSGRGRAAAAGAAVVLAGVFALAPQAQAQSTPDPALLEALKARLVTEQQCVGPCVSASRIDIVVDDLDVVMRADVHAQKTAGWALPGPDDPLRILEVRVDGRPTTELRRTATGLLAVRLTPGAHTVEVRGRLVNRPVVTVQFDPQNRPKYASFTSAQWTVDGIDRQGTPDGSLQLTRQSDGGAEAAAGSEDMGRELPPWFEIQRHVALGVTWQIRTTVTRIQADRPQPFRYPLLAGEAVITDGLRVEDGHVLIDFARDVSTVVFTSEFAVSPEFALVAPVNVPWTETWTVECSAIWRCDFDGLVNVDTVLDGTYQPRWFPWPGERLGVAVNRPEGAAGQATTVELVRYTVTPGRRLLEASLELQVRSSQGGWQNITLPQGAELQLVRRDAEETSIRPRDGIVQLPVRPGSQTYFLQWQQPWERALRETFPTVDIGSAAVNANLEMQLAGDRWLLWTTGPSWGPAVLFWSHLVLLLIVAGLLGLWRRSPLRIHEWLLLTIGVSQLPVVAIVLIVAWFIAFQWRREEPLKEVWTFDLMQLALVGLTMIAMGCLYAAIHTNLLIDIDMQVRGMGSYNTHLKWYVDRVGAELPVASIISLPIWVWRGLMLLWSLWLSWKLLKWLPWAWQGFTTDGIWRTMRPAPAAPAGEPARQPASEGGQGGES